MVPSWQVPGDPFLLAAVVGAVTVACLWLARWLGSRAIKFERTMLAGFLVAMPLVYVMGWFAARDHAASSWIWVELLGLALFAAFAALGLKNSPWFLAIGIAGQDLELLVEISTQVAAGDAILSAILSDFLPSSKPAKFSLGTLLDNLGEKGVFLDNLGSQTNGKTTRSSAGYSRYAHPEGDLPEPLAWLRHSAANPADFERAAGNSARIFVSSALPP
jgi:hypothetical protein